MVTYIILANWTDQGVRNVKDSPRRLDVAKKALRDPRLPCAALRDGPIWQARVQAAGAYPAQQEDQRPIAHHPRPDR